MSSRPLRWPTRARRPPWAPLTRVTFHPSYTYEDFIEGFRPHAGGAGGLSLALEDGLFKRVCRAAQANPGRPYLLLIDEINRGNVAKIMGELLTLLERDKRGLTLTLPQSKETFSVPPNVFLLGTMNTADRSIKLLDAALRRRFAFLECMPDSELLHGAEVGDLALDDFLDGLNQRIARFEGREKQVGHSYLLVDGQPVDEVEEFAARFREEVYHDVALMPEDRAVIEKLSASADDRVQIEELRRGLRVRTRSWVGVVRLPTVEIRIVPKVTGDQLGLVRLLDYASGLDALTRLPDGATLEAAGNSLLELLVLLFVEASERVLRRGLLSGYVEREDDLPIVRGRILADRQVLERFGQLDRIICRFDELEHAAVENRLLTAALQVASPLVTSVELQRRISRLRGVLEPICDTDQLDLAGARTTVTYNRLNAHYETAHRLGWILFDALGVDDLLAPGEVRSFSFLLNMMNQLFERFATRAVEQILPAARYRASSQIPFKSVVWNVSSQRPYANIIPDVVVERRGEGARRVAIDAKYKLYDERGFDQGDVYQTFLYAFALGATASDGLPTSLLMYPATADEPGSTRLRIRRLTGGAGAEIVGIGLPIAALLKELTAGSGETPLRDGLATVIEESFGNNAHHRQTAAPL